ncbi:hypothetical protein CN918_29005 [Priestia megaterium]|nr:hypothetical protein CN918_29005 [Priestia megaterium]
MPLYITIGFVFFVITGFIFILVRKMKDEGEKENASLFLAIMIASATICFMFVLPAFILFGIVWCVAYMLPELLSTSNFTEAYSLSFLAIALVFVVEIFFGGIISGIIRYFKLPVPLAMAFKTLVYTILLYCLAANLFAHLTVTFIGALIVSIFIVLIERIVEEWYQKRFSSDDDRDATL